MRSNHFGEVAEDIRCHLIKNGCYVEKQHALYNSNCSLRATLLSVTTFDQSTCNIVNGVTKCTRCQLNNMVAT